MVMSSTHYSVQIHQISETMKRLTTPKAHVPDHYICINVAISVLANYKRPNAKKVSDFV